MDDDKINVIKDAIKAVVETDELGVDPLYPILFAEKFGIDRKIAALAYVLRVDKSQLLDILPKRSEGEGVNARASVDILVKMFRDARGFKPKEVVVKEPVATHMCKCTDCTCGTSSPIPPIAQVEEVVETPEEVVV